MMMATTTGDDYSSIKLSLFGDFFSLLEEAKKEMSKAAAEVRKGSRKIRNVLLADVANSSSSAAKVSPPPI